MLHTVIFIINETSKQRFKGGWRTNNGNIPKEMISNLELAECLRKTGQQVTIHRSLYKGRGLLDSGGCVSTIQAWVEKDQRE